MASLLDAYRLFFPTARQNYEDASKKEATDISLKMQRQKMAEDAASNSPISSYIKNVTEPQYRQDSNIPYGPMTPDQSAERNPDNSFNGYNSFKKDPMSVLKDIPLNRLEKMGPLLTAMKKPEAGEDEGNKLLSPQEAYSLGVPYGTTRKQAAGKIPKNERQSSLDTERDQRRQDAYNKNKADVIAKFNADPSVRKYQSSGDAAEMIKDLADSGNPIAAASIPTYSARMAGEVGNLSEADKRPFGGSQAILVRFNAALQQAANGQLTPDNKKFISDLADIVSKRTKANMSKMSKKYGLQYGKLENYGTPDEISGILYSDMSPDQTQTGIKAQDANSLKSSVPAVGESFNGEKVLSVTKVK